MSSSGYDARLDPRRHEYYEGKSIGYQWAKAEEWRRHPLYKVPFSRFLPGFQLGVGCFVGYLIYDNYIKVKEVHGHH
jgi:hypothetical protein